MSEHFTISIRPSTGGQRKFAVTSKEAVVFADYASNSNIPGQSDQTWDAWVWQRIAGRGYVCRLSGGGQWSNRGDHGDYIGVGNSAYAALEAAWGGDGEREYDYSAMPNDLAAPMRDYDATVQPIVVE